MDVSHTYNDIFALETLLLTYRISSMTVNIYPGYESSLEMSQLYSVTYSCDFELLMFPFDAQVRGLLKVVFVRTVLFLSFTVHSVLFIMLNGYIMPQFYIKRSFVISSCAVFTSSWYRLPRRT